MNIPISIATSFSTTATSFFLSNVYKPTLIRKLFLHNNDVGSVNVHLVYGLGISTSTDTTQNFLFEKQTLNSGASYSQEMIIVNPGDSFGIQCDTARTVNVIANVAEL